MGANNDSSAGPKLITVREPAATCVLATITVVKVCKVESKRGGRVRIRERDSGRVTVRVRVTT
jgi:hypothetical protein